MPPNFLCGNFFRDVLFDLCSEFGGIGESGDTRRPSSYTQQHTHMNTTIQLPASAAEAINQLQARKQGLLALLPKGSFPFEERHEADCRAVPCGIGSGGMHINHAVEEINQSIALIIKRCLVDHNW